MKNFAQTSPTQPYLLRALHEWCCDNGLTPYLVVRVDRTVQVPSDFVQNGQIVLNIDYEATSGLKMGNEFIEFKARFGGKAHDIVVPVSRVMAIYAKENGQGMAFQVEDEHTDMNEQISSDSKNVVVISEKKTPLPVHQMHSEDGKGAGAGPDAGGKPVTLRRIK